MLFLDSVHHLLPNSKSNVTQLSSKCAVCTFRKDAAEGRTVYVLVLKDR